MLSSNSQSSNLKSTELTINRISTFESTSTLEKYLSKIKTKDVEHVKLYLGMVYFTLVSILSISLFL